MPWFALKPDSVDYEISPGVQVVVHRATLRVEVDALRGLNPYCFFDSGAPFSVVSQLVATRLPFSPLPITNNPIPRTQGGRPVAAAPTVQLTTWWDPIAQVAVPCVLGELTVSLRHTTNGTTTGPLQLLAKVLTGPTLTFGGSFVLLGTHFLVANGGKLHLEGQAWGLGGPGLYFPP